MPGPASPDIEKDIRDYLANTVGLSPVSISALTPLPINQYAVVEYYGTSIAVHGDGLPKLDQARLQIQCRNASRQQGKILIHAVATALDGLADVTINTRVYTYMREVARPRILDTQEDGSTIFYWEVEVQVRR